jgi:hypothetical protein
MKRNPGRVLTSATFLGATLAVLFGGSAPAKAQGQGNQEPDTGNLQSCLSTCKQSRQICEQGTEDTNSQGDDKKCADDQERCERECRKLYR